MKRLTDIFAAEMRNNVGIPIYTYVYVHIVDYIVYLEAPLSTGGVPDVYSWCTTTLQGHLMCTGADRYA